MNQQLSEGQVRATCRELLRGGGRLSGRQLRLELRQRFGAVGKTERIFSIWREEAARARPAPAPATGDVAQWERRLAESESRAAALQARAELAEYREQAHQERWALEIDRLRQRLQAQEGREAELRHLRDRVLELSRELMAARAGRAGHNDVEAD